VDHRLACPYGQVGDRLWVREAWVDLRGGEFGAPYAYKGIEDEDGERCRNEFGYRWKPSIYMPRQACRTVLEITALRVERLHEISPSDALAEGIFCPEVGYAQHGERAPVLLYGFLWESINGKGSWERNDWVWVVSFTKVQEA
jgi:hypothetical protein